MSTGTRVAATAPAPAVNPFISNSMQQRQQQNQHTIQQQTSKNLQEETPQTSIDLLIMQYSNAKI